MGTAADPGGTLVVAAPVVWGRVHAVPIVAAMLDRYPGLSVQLRLSDRVVPIAEEGIDVAMRIGELKDSAMRAVRVGEVRRILAASPAYLAARPAPTSVADLRAHDIIAFTGTSPLDEWRFGRNGRTSVSLRPRLVVDSADAAIEAALRGVGVGMFLSYQVEEHLAAGRLSALLNDSMPSALPVHLVFQASRAGAPNIRAFIEAAMVRLQAYRAA